MSGYFQTNENGLENSFPCTRHQLRIELTDADRDQSSADVVAIEFKLRNGQLIVSEVWAESDESYGSGCSISIPPRVLAIALLWIAERMAPVSSEPESDETR